MWLDPFFLQLKGRFISEIPIRPQVQRSLQERCGVSQLHLGGKKKQGRCYYLHRAQKAQQRAANFGAGRPSKCEGSRYGKVLRFMISSRETDTVKGKNMDSY